MEDLAVVIAILGFIGTPLAAWITIQRKTAKLEAENTAYDKQLIAIDKELDRLENDYKERIDKVIEDQRNHERSVTQNFRVLFKRMDDDKKEIIDKLGKIGEDIARLKGKLSQ